MKTKLQKIENVRRKGQRLVRRNGTQLGERTVTRRFVPTALGIKTILIPTDFSPHSEKVLEYAIPFARKFGAKLTLIHVIEPIATPDFEASFPLVLENEKAKEFCNGVLTRTAEKFELKPELLERKLVRYGRPYHEITEAARTLKVDLIIIATHGHTGLKHAFLGSTAERVVRHAPCPVLVVRSQGRKFEISTN
jgi:universal stress protein A